MQRLKQTASHAAHTLAINERQVVGAYEQLASIIRAVSYTHLTLPTILRV